MMQLGERAELALMGRDVETKISEERKEWNKNQLTKD